MISTRTANCILTYGSGVWGGGLPLSPVEKTLNKLISVNISGTNWKSIVNSRAMHFQCVPLNFMCPQIGDKPKRQQRQQAYSRPLSRAAVSFPAGADQIRLGAKLPAAAEFGKGPPLQKTVPMVMYN